jgi:unsaturated chondroitin disaccharide hydrolase
MAAQLPLQEGEKLKTTARRLLHPLATKYAANSEGDGLLLHGTYSKKSPYNTCTPEGVDECLTWGDYFYLEGLLRLSKPDWKPYW